jgi:hypothetical protein
MNTVAPFYSPLFKDIEAEENYRRWKGLVCDVFIKCLINHDKNGIIELANAAEFFKDKINAGENPSYPLYFKLLELKQFNNLFPNRRIYIGDIAKSVYSKDNYARFKIEGFTDLKRVCNRLGVLYGLLSDKDKKEKRRPTNKRKK